MINCKGSTRGQTKANNGGVEPAKVFKLAMPAFHTLVAIRPETAAVFLVSEPNWSLPGTLSHLIPEGERQGAIVSSLGGKNGGAAVVWGSQQLGRVSPDLDCSPPPYVQRMRTRSEVLAAKYVHRMRTRRHNALLRHFAVAELQLQLPPEVTEGSPVAAGGAPACTCLFLGYHGPHK